MNEKALCHIWNSLRFAREHLRDDEGQPLQLVYRGRWQAGAGPDFRGAIVARGDGYLLHGDVEIHLRSGEWFAHGHERDPLFNRVVLHVVLQDDGRRHTQRQDGQRVPVLALAPYLTETVPVAVPPPLWPEEPCRRLLPAQSDDAVGALLDRAGEQRWRERLTACEGDLAALGPDETLYRRLLDALGYSQNREPMRELAARLPYADLARLGDALPAAQREAGLAEILLGAAGLASDTGWRHYVAPGETLDPMAAVRWRLAGLRPANSPQRRLRGAAALLARTMATGLAQGLYLDWPAGGPRAVGRALLRRLVVAETGAAGAGHVGHLIGPGRASDIVVNVVLPMAAAYADLTADTALAAGAWQAYESYPRLAENELTRRMAGLLLGDGRRRLERGARRQQGLLHLFRRYCDLQRCAECPAGGAGD
ncbi:MAG: DUF2851 family protein [Chloroflexota bacterium]